MKIFPIIPVWIMFIICIILIFYIIIKKRDKIQIVIIILIFIINLRIMIPSNNTKKINNNLDILFVIDNTISMTTLDYNGNNTRLSAVKTTCEHIINELCGARYSIITFDNTSKIITPFTYDENITKEAIQIITPINELYAKGSSIDTPLETILSILKNSQKNNTNHKILFFMSDGENTNQEKIKSFNSISKYINNGAILGYGTTKGGYMKTDNNYTTSEYIIDNTNPNYEKAISKIDEYNLKKIANETNVDYIHMTNQNNINYKIKQIKKIANSSQEKNDKSTYEDTYYIIIIPLLILLFVEFNKFRRKTI